MGYRYCDGGSVPCGRCDGTGKVGWLKKKTCSSCSGRGSVSCPGCGNCPDADMKRDPGPTYWERGYGGRGGGRG